MKEVLLEWEWAVKEYIMFKAFTSVTIYAVLYLFLHELGHYIAALAVGLQPRFGLSTDGVVPSPSVKINGNVDGGKRLLILYAPYIINIVLLLFAPLPLRLVALFTLPNILLEDEARRSERFKVALALLVGVALCVAALI